MEKTVNGLGHLLGLMFVLALPLFLVTSNVRVAFNTQLLYEVGFDRHDVESRTGLSSHQLTVAAEQIREYFNSEDDLIKLRIPFGETTKGLFLEREVLHMRDVKELVSLAYRFQEGLFLFILLFITLGFLVRGSQFSIYARKLLIRGSTVTIILVGTIGLLSLIAFDPLFRLFHELSFSNDLWILDPTRDYLVQLFPLGFWMESTVIIGIISIAQAGGIMGLVAIHRLWQEWRRRVARSRKPQYT